METELICTLVLGSLSLIYNIIQLFIKLKDNKTILKQSKVIDEMVNDEITDAIIESNVINSELKYNNADEKKQVAIYKSRNDIESATGIQKDLKEISNKIERLITFSNLVNSNKLDLKGEYANGNGNNSSNGDSNNGNDTGTASREDIPTPREDNGIGSNQCQESIKSEGSSKHSEFDIKQLY